MQKMSEQIIFKLTVKSKQALEKISNEENVPVSYILRKMIDRYLNERNGISAVKN